MILSPLDRILMESIDKDDMLDLVKDLKDVDESFDFDTSIHDEIDELFPVD